MDEEASNRFEVHRKFYIISGAVTPISTADVPVRLAWLIERFAAGRVRD
jgi:hypothetical protein